MEKEFKKVAAHTHHKLPSCEYDRSKPPRFFLGQILLCVLIIALIVSFGDQIYRDDIDGVQQVRLNSEIEKLLNAENKNGIQLTRIDADAMLSREAVGDSLRCGDSTVCYFAFRTNIGDTGDPQPAQRCPCEYPHHHHDSQRL